MPRGGTLRLAARIDNGRAASPQPPNGALGERALPGEEELSLEVQDEGVGIPAEQLDGIFQPFHGGFAKGSGLGLAIVQRIVSDHQGEIHVASDVGKGTSVKVTLPLPAGVGTAA
jgi:signal transduction histidine kinase